MNKIEMTTDLVLLVNKVVTLNNVEAAKLSISFSEYFENISKPKFVIEAPPKVTMTLDESILFMKENPGVKVRGWNYRSYEYNYYDKKKDKILMEDGLEFSVKTSYAYGEIDGFSVVEKE